MHIGGFNIKELRVTGSGKISASLDFGENVTVIVGPSNTGKSYVFQCIKYLLGATKQPKKIDQSKGYDKAFIELKLSSGSTETLYRSLLGGNILLYKCSISEVSHYKNEPETLLADSQSTKTHRTISEYLNALSGLKNTKVRKNAAGETENVGFWMMRQLSLIDEVSIIKEESPLLGGQYTQETKEKSFVRLLISGMDDSSIVPKPKAKIVHNREGRLEIIEALINEYQRDLDDFGLYSEDFDISEQMNKLKSSIDEKQSELRKLFGESERIESTVDEHWQTWKNSESRLINIEELLVRFNLLAKHYDTDIARLEAVNEASIAFAELEIANCPVCESTISNIDKELNVEEVRSVATASEKEILKILELREDIEITIENLFKERDELAKLIERSKSEYRKHQIKFDAFKSSKIRTVMDKIESSKAKNRELKQVQRLIDRIKTLADERDVYEKEIEPAKSKRTFDNISASTLSGVCKEVKSLLNDWKYDKVNSVSFSEEKMDLVINGNDRELSGKGYRALAYSALIIGLLKFCVNNSKPHSRLVILDSPLCTLRSRHIERSNNFEEKDIISDEVKDAFYTNLQTFEGEGQIIILDNDGPSNKAMEKLKYHEFSKNSKKGRFGFFPVT